MSYYLKSEPFSTLELHIPRSIYKILKDYSEQRRLPATRLVAYAIDNELDCNPSFNYPTIAPAMPYVPNAYAEEAGLILDFLKKHFKNGMGLDLLTLLRRDIGVPNKNTFLLGIRELQEAKLIEEVEPRWSRFDYGPNYKYLQAVGYVNTKKQQSYRGP